MKFKVWGENLPELKIEAETANTALLKAKMVNSNYLGVTPIRETPQARYNKKNIRPVVVKLNYRTDMDILEVLEKEPNMQGYIKRLIREEIKRNNS